MPREIDRAQIRWRQRLRIAQATDDWRAYRKEQDERRALRAGARLEALAVMLPKGCHIDPIGTLRNPYKVRVWTPRRQDSIVWEPAHNQVRTPAGSFDVDGPGVARIMAGLVADERDGVYDAVYN